MPSRFQEKCYTTARIFAFGSILVSAGCATDGSLTPSAQQDASMACASIDASLTVARDFNDRFTDAQRKMLANTQIAVESLCSPSALASYSTPAALQTAMQQLNAAAVAINQANASVSAKSTAPNT